jgi:hypothetical protein
VSQYGHLEPVQGLAAPAHTLTRVMAELEQLAREFGEALALSNPDAAVINPYRWFQSTMHLPAVWHWLMPSSTEDLDLCAVEDTARIVVSLATSPAADAGEDMLSVEVLADAYLPMLDGRRLNGSSTPLGAKRVRRTGFAMVSDPNLNALVLEVSLELELEREPA